MAQAKALERAESLQREVVEVADSILGAGAGGGADAVRALQRAWLEARQRMREAEGKAHALTTSVEGRDKLVERSAEKIANLRASILAVEATNERLKQEVQRLVEKVASQRDQLGQLLTSLEQGQQKLATGVLATRVRRPSSRPNRCL
ncbi:MAG: hypothetical protein R3C16_12880 [Hyphomonadaceae bacterium]